MNTVRVFSAIPTVVSLPLEVAVRIGLDEVCITAHAERAGCCADDESTIIGLLDIEDPFPGSPSKCGAPHFVAIGICSDDVHIIRSCSIGVCSAGNRTPSIIRGANVHGQFLTRSTKGPIPEQIGLRARRRCTHHTGEDNKLRNATPRQIHRYFPPHLLLHS